MKKFLLLVVISSFSIIANAQPELSSWILNTTNATGYNGIPSNIQKLQYSDNYIYVSASCIPGYDIGPWKANPNTPSNQNFVFKITRKPTKNTGTAVKIQGGHTGIWTNGVSIFNAWDAQSYNNAGVWNRNAYFWEGVSFDNCLGHPAPNGEYHHHVSPTCLYNSADSSKHSPIIGFAWDGFPIYGAYGHKNTDGTGKITRMISSYRLKNANSRLNGPTPDMTYPLGCFLEDYEYNSTYGTLDDRNGRFCVTPEYPNGTYCYFVTIDESQKPVFPYTLYGSYYGVVTQGNTGPGSGHVTISETVQTYTGSTSSLDPNSILTTQIYPNPSVGDLTVFIDNTNENNFEVEIYNLMGQRVYKQEFVQPGIQYPISTKEMSSGVYSLKINRDGKTVVAEKLVIQNNQNR